MVLRSPEPDALHDGEMVEHVRGGDARIDAELLRQVAELAADRILIGDNVEAVEQDGACVGILQRGDGAHESGLARAVGSK
jgi:hypothetical protein